MTARRFVGANSREAMNRVRLVLGDDALILSSRMTDEGVEIMAMADEALVEEHVSAPAMADDSPVPVSPYLAAAAYARQTEAFAPAPRALPLPAEVPVATPGPVAQSAPDFNGLGERLLQEVQDMRQLIDQREVVPANAPDTRGAWLKWLLDAGFSTGLAEEIIGDAPPALEQAEQQQAWLVQRLGSQLQCLHDDDELFGQAGVIALVGPTGVGKTTTTAKLAARYVMRHGASQVALVTTDSFRIGAHEQLGIYARLLGVELHALSPTAALDQLLASLAGKRLVIIDTVGMGQRDRRLLTQINQLGASQRPLRLTLVLNAASHGDTLEEVVQTWRNAAREAGCRLDDCIVSKCDEAVRLGPALDIAIRHGLRLDYLSVGQQVPEDLHLADATAVLRQALDVSKPSLFAARPAPSTGQRLDTLVRGLLGQGRRIAALRERLARDIPGFAHLLAAWPLLDLPPAQQVQRWAALLQTLEQREPAAPDGLLLWGAPRPGTAATWSMPLLNADAQGHLHALPWLAHRLPIGAVPRLSWSQANWPAHRHLWPACPDRDTLAALQAADLCWLATARGSQRVHLHGERQRLDELAAYSESFGWREVRHRNRTVRLSLRHLSIVLGKDTPARAWFGTLQDGHSGQALGQRYWLADAGSEVRGQAAGITLQLAHEPLAQLTGRGWKLLAGIQPRLDAGLRLYLAAGLAATAVRLAQDSDDQAFQARTQLLELLTNKRGASAGVLLESLLHLMAVSDTFARMEKTEAP